jgi:O-antigen/teichoic acid export membrane protein
MLGRLRGGAASRATTTMADQCVASASNFAVGIIVARLSGPAGLGAFAFAYTCWILLTTIHRSLITDPMAILGHMRQQERDDVVRRGFAAEVALGAAAAGVFAAAGVALMVCGQRTFGTGMLAIAPWVIALDLQDYWRWIGFMQGVPRKSLYNDLVFNAVQALAFGFVFLSGQHSVFAIVSAWGLGAMVATVYGLFQFSVRPSLRGGIAFLRSHWAATSSWLVSERAASWGASQLFLIVAGALLGAAALGGLKASQALVMGPVFVVINAGGSFGLPEATRQLADRGWAGMARVSRFVTGAGVSAAIAGAVAVLVAAPALLKLLYGPEFVPYATSARVFAVSMVVGAFGVGPILNLTATRRLRPLFVVQLGRLVFSVAAVCVLADMYGATGAAVSNLLTGMVTLVALWILQASARRSHGEAQKSAPAFIGTVRRRLVKNTHFLLLLSPLRPSSWPPSNGSRDRTSKDVQQV